MKRLITFLFLISFFALQAQNKSFTKKWDEVYKLMNEGKLKSTAPLLNEIYNSAQKAKKPEHLIKALIFKSSIALQTSDNEDIAIETEKNFLDEIAKAQNTEKSVLQSLLAELYFNYYRNNYYKIINRTTLNSEGSDDFRTWDSSRFLKEIHLLLQASLEPVNLLAQTQVDTFEVLLEGNSKWRFLRPNLYDLLANRALNIYQNSMFREKDFSLETKALAIEEIYNHLIKVNKNNPDALIEASLQKIKYDYKDQLGSNQYRSALENLYQKYKQEKWSANILFELASTYYNHNEEKSDYVKAIQLLNQAIEKSPNSHGALKCLQLKQTIEKATLSLDTDGSFLANHYNPLYIKHKNVEQIYYRIYDIKENDLDKIPNGFEYDYKVNELIIPNNKTPLKTGNIKLKSFKDYKSHVTKIPFEPLAEGNYILILSTTEKFNSVNQEPLLQNVISSTNIDISVREIANNDAPYMLVQLLNKATGLPLKNEKIELFESNKNDSFELFQTTTTDNFGRFKLNNTQSFRYYKTFLVKPSSEKTYLTFNSYGSYNSAYRNANNKRMVTFTDRKIYRPGQTIYFKSIAYNSQEEKYSVSKNEKVTFILKNNDQEISKLELTTNEFGSVNGEFRIPSTSRTGYYYIYNSWTSFNEYIHVEEYKRPKFETSIKPLKDIYTLGSTIKVIGNATTFSGANVSDAKVIYRVYRQAYNPYYWWRSHNKETEVEITQGETVTDKNGNYRFDFTALPAKPKKENEYRAYSYKIIADVTDISGETHTTESSVRIGDIPFQIKLNIESQGLADKFDSIPIITTNLNGEKTGLKGVLKITEIKPLNHVLREQQNSVEYELLSKKEWEQKLPYISYNNNYLAENRERSNIVLTQPWDSSQSEFLKLDKKLPAGIYEVKATSVYENDTIEMAKIIEVYDRSKNTHHQTYFSSVLNKDEFEPGDMAEITFNSNADDAHLLVELVVKGKVVDKHFLNLNKSNIYSFPIKEEYRGNVYVNTYFAKYNQSLSKTITIKVPYNNKKLEITTSTFRNKLEPGQEETWELNIKGTKGEKFLAEVLAGMYDKSLDQFKKNPWHFTVYPINKIGVEAWKNYNNSYFKLYKNYRVQNTPPQVSFENLSLFGLSLDENRAHLMVLESKAYYPKEERVAPLKRKELASLKAESNLSIDDSTNSENNIEENKTEENLETVIARKNLEETAFFFPNLRTDKEGNVKIQFTTPESLTTWNFQAVAHTEDLKTGTFQSDVITQKELMVVPNAPRFLREGDVLTFKSKIINLSDGPLKGKAKLLLFDAFTMQPIDSKFNLAKTEHSFLVDAKGNTTVEWTLDIPKVDEVQSVLYRVVAATDKFSDGEENVLPILTNRTLVTETLPMSVRENQTKTFSLDKLKNTTSSTRDNFKLTLEMTTNPIWYAVMALPYLREYPYECSEQIFARFYANVISQNIVNSNLKIKAVFDDWNRKNQLISPLEKNEELKNILLEETPWVRAAQNESEQMKRIAVLFDLNNMRQELKDTYLKLSKKQSNNGGFPWFEGGKDNFYITAHIVAGFGHLEKMEVLNQVDVHYSTLVDKAIQYIDHEMENRWNKFQEAPKKYSISNHDGLYWLYARSFHLSSNPMSDKLQKAKAYFIKELDENKYKQSIHTQAMLSLVLYRYSHVKAAKDLIFSIKDRAVESEEMGMYWKENVSGYLWHEAPVETQSLLIEAFNEITPKDIESVESMKVWLLKNKQTNEWNSTKATTEAVYALMNTGKDWSNAEDGITVKLGNNVWYSNTVKPSQDIQSGSGYVKESWMRNEITPEMANVHINKTSPGVAWGAMYWQYFEDLDKISGANTQVKFNKKLFIQRNTNQGPKLFEINSQSPIQVGDLVKVRLEIQTDRAMEFVHIKDMRASGFEPVNVISSYKWQSGIGYFESTRDVATNFFIDYLPKGVYVFEYDLRANNAGDFSNGITQMQNMYAPEFSAHSEGIRVEIK